MGAAGNAACGTSEHEVTLTRSFEIGLHEVTNQEFLDAIQWAFDNGHVTATTTGIWDNMDGSTEQLLDLVNEFVEIQFEDMTSQFFLRESPLDLCSDCLSRWLRSRPPPRKIDDLVSRRPLL